MGVVGDVEGRPWRGRPQPLGDERNFSDPAYRLATPQPPELSLLLPPPVGTVLPLTPLTAAELQAALVLPEAESRAALLRCLEHYGASRLQTASSDEEEPWELPFGVAPDARQAMTSSFAWPWVKPWRHTLR